MLRTALRPCRQAVSQLLRPVQRALHDPAHSDPKPRPQTTADNADTSSASAPHTTPPPPPPPPPRRAELTLRSETSSGGAGGSFEDITDKNRSTYIDLVRIFESRSVHRRNHVEFIYAALRNMKDFNVHRDIEVYKALMNVLPKGKYIPTNIIQAEFQHYPKQQQVIIDLLEQMEDNAVIPDHEMQDILVNTFGRRGHPVLKYWRMLYWMPKFKNASPWMLPSPVPNDAQQLARLAVERMCSVDLQTRVSVYDTAEVSGSIDRTWIVSGQSAEQAELLRNHGSRVPLRVEGPFVIWLRDKQVYYFLLRGDAMEKRAADDEQRRDADDVSKLSFNRFTMRADKALLAERTSVHSQDDGTIYAICATGTSTKDSLLSWIRLLEQDNNPALGTLPVLFKFRSTVANQLAVV